MQNFFSRKFSLLVFGLFSFKIAFVTQTKGLLVSTFHDGEASVVTVAPVVHPIFETIGKVYFYAVLLLLAHVTIRYFWLKHFKDLRLSLYTAGVMLVLISTITLF